MHWHQVIILKSDVADASATSLMNKYDAALRAEINTNGLPEGALVGHGISAGNHVFFFSPAAVAIAKAAGILNDFDISALSEPPNLDGYTKF